MRKTASSTTALPREGTSAARIAGNEADLLNCDGWSVEHDLSSRGSRLTSGLAVSLFKIRSVGKASERTSHPSPLMEASTVCRAMAAPSNVPEWHSIYSSRTHTRGKLMSLTCVVLRRLVLPVLWS